MTWYYNDKVYDITPEEYQGFVYEITETASNKKYIGKRIFGDQKLFQRTLSEKKN